MTTLAGRYVLAEPLGSGGMARVFAATDELLHRRVAVKLLRTDLAADPLVRERLVREARAAASFTHPNAVAVFDTGEDDGVPFIVMELVEGRTLADRLREGPLPLDETLAIVADVLSALGAAHAIGLVHRDVKPANVLLPASGGAKLADFGIAKGMREAAGGLTATGQVLGTPRYLSPEQVSGAAATPRSDLYAMGVLCYEMLAGESPFTGGTPIAIAMAHQTEPPPPLDERRPDLPAHVVAAVHRALEKSPEARFDSARQMQAALDGSAAGLATAPLGAPADLDATQVLPDAPETMALTAPAPGRERIEDTGVAAPRQRTMSAPLLGIIGLVALLLVAGWVLSRGAGEPADEGLAEAPVTTPDPAAADPTEEAEQQVAEPAVEQTPEPDPEPTPTPAPPPETDSIGALIADLTEDPDAAGEKGEDLRDKLQDLLDKDEEDQPKEARKLIDEAAKWAEKGELEPSVAARTATVLAPIAQREDQADDDDQDENENGNEGRGRGQADD
jgi:eukaryotic-like serine/threonine-protein kinase